MVALTFEPTGAEEELAMDNCLPPPATGNDDAFEISSSAAAVAVLRGTVARRACSPARPACTQHSAK